MANELKPCPFCSKPLSIRGGVNPYGRCNTDGCWMMEAKLSVVCDDPKQAERWNIRPAAPVEGLETVARQWRWGGDERWRQFGPIFDDEPREVRELVTRSQAESIIAAERNRAEVAEYKLDQAVNTVQPMIIQRAERAEGEISEISGHLDCEPDSDSILHTIREIQADNAVLTARVARDDAAFQELIKLGKEADTKFEALEAQLAAFRKPTTAMKSAVSRYTNGSYDLAHAAIEDLVRAALEAKS